jgi:hypothetical protein
MIPSLTQVLDAQIYLARRFQFDPRHDEALLAACLRDAEALAVDSPDDELAATLFALTLRTRALGAGWERVPLMLLANQALARGFVIDVTSSELMNLRFRVVTRRVTFADLRAWVAAHLRPMPGR